MGIAITVPGPKKKKGVIAITVPGPTRPPQEEEFVGPPEPEKEETSYEYLREYGDAKSQARFGIVERLPPSRSRQVLSQVAGVAAHKSLSPEEKEEFGYRYTKWEEIPVTERKQYYGGKQHLESLSPSEREQMLEKFKEEEPRSAFFYKEFYSLYGKSDKYIQEQMWKGVTLTEEQQQKRFWKSVPEPIRWPMAGVYAFGSAVVWPITLPQTGIKLLTGGKTLFLPDVGKELSKYQPRAMPSGLISTGISEGIGAITGEGSDAWARFQEDSFSGISATVGEIAGLKVGGTVVKGGLKTYRITRVGLKYGKKDMMSYIRGEKILAKHYPVAKGYPKIYRSGDKYASIW